MAAGGGTGSYKVVLVGDVEVGKTTLFNRFKLGRFVDSGDEKQTRQQAEHSKTWEYEGETYSVSLYYANLSLQHFIARPYSKCNCY